MRRKNTRITRCGLVRTLGPIYVATKYKWQIWTIRVFLRLIFSRVNYPFYQAWHPWDIQCNDLKSAEVKQCVVESIDPVLELRYAKRVKTTDMYTVVYMVVVRTWQIRWAVAVNTKSGSISVLPFSICCRLYVTVRLYVCCFLKFV